MGKTFREHTNGQRLYNCAVCNANLTNWDELISTRFRGTTGPAYLFKRVVNLTYSEVQCRLMNTGHHLVRDVMCKNCTVKLGWMYEFTMHKLQQYRCRPTNLLLLNIMYRYKEGAVLLEQSLIVQAKGFPDDENLQ
uniref:Protein yippee-like n=1 Tax=Anopheles culicifacies TaxID=139723 RepID=A0A182ME03_9DIPT